jgi:hypothetical protein
MQGWNARGLQRATHKCAVAIDAQTLTLSQPLRLRAPGAAGKWPGTGPQPYGSTGAIVTVCCAAVMMRPLLKRRLIVERAPRSRGTFVGGADMCTCSLAPGSEAMRPRFLKARWPQQSVCRGGASAQWRDGGGE